MSNPVLRFALVLAAAFTLLIGGVTWGGYRKLAASVREQVISCADNLAERELRLRGAIARLGHVYAPVSETLRPAEALRLVPERDLTTHSGRSLTLVDPRTLGCEPGAFSDGNLQLQWRYVGVAPLNPVNAPDAWESRALEALSRGAALFASDDPEVGPKHHRRMTPMVAARECLRCHVSRKQGDLLGGLSVSFELEPISGLVLSAAGWQLGANLLIWLLGLLALTVATGRFTQLLHARESDLRTVRENQERLRSILAALPDVVLVLDEDGRFLEILTGDEALLYDRPERVRGRLLAEVLDPEQAQPFMRFIAETLASNEVQRIEYRLDVPRGQVWFEGRGFALPRPSGAKRAIVFLARDVSERKLAEREIAQLNRTLRLLGKANEILLRATAETQFLQEVCQAIVKLGGYGLAWVGFADGDEAGIIRPVARAGDLCASLEDSRLTWADGDPCAVARALRSRKPYLAVGDVVNTATWLDPARHACFGAILALPLLHGGDCLGVLAICATASTAFGQADCELLTDLADNLAYGLASLRARELQRQAKLESEYTQIVQTALDGFLMLGPDGSVLDVNLAYCAMSGYSRDELLGMRVHELEAQETPEEVDAHLRAMLRTGHDRFESQHRRKDGTVFPIEASARLTDLRGGALIAFVEDVTIRRCSALRLAESEERYRALFDKAHDAMFVTTLEPDGSLGRFLEVNDEACNRLGYSRPELLRMSPRDLDSPESAARIPEHLARLRESGSLVFEAVHRTSTGALVPVELSVHRVELGGAGVTLSIARDLTFRKQAESSLRKLSLALEQSPAAVLVTDVSGNIEYVNRRFTEVTGFRREDVLGRNPRIMKSGTHPPEFYKTMWTTLGAGRQWTGEFCNRKASGELYWESASIAPMRDALERTTHYVCVKEDITERKRVAADLRAAVEAAQAANLAKSQFLAHMSHEIRTPLNAILGFAQLLERDQALTPLQRERVRTINRGGEHLLGLINSVLEVSKIEAGSVEVTAEEIDLHDLLAELGQIMRVRAEAKGLWLRMTIAESVPRRVRSDPGKLRQILLNLLGNAVKFSLRGGVALQASASRLEQGLCRLQVDVTDTGVGVAPEEMSRLFVAFEQTASGRKLGGTGLGLAISHQYALTMRGELTARSQTGAGSTFSLTLPVEAAAESPAANAYPAPCAWRLSDGFPAPRVLVVDDREENRCLLRELLESAGFSVREASSGEQALHALDKEPTEAVLMDLRMPEMDGFEAIRRVRALPLQPGPRVLAISASAFDEDQRRALDCGADGFIGKPFRHDDLLRRLGQLLGVAFESAQERSPIDRRRTPRPPAPDLPELERLPVELRERLRQAAIEGNASGLREAVEELARVAPELAAALGRYTDRYDYDSVLAAVDAGPGESLVPGPLGSEGGQQ